MSNATRELLEQHFDTAFAAPDGIKKLREVILTLAMQGKLVPQDASDPPASQLLKDIDAEKRQLVKEGKIKAPKSLPEIKPEEVPYALPKGWEWVRIRDICHDWGQKTPDSPDGHLNFPHLWPGQIPPGQTTVVGGLLLGMGSFCKAVGGFLEAIALALEFEQNGTV